MIVTLPPTLTLFDEDSMVITNCGIVVVVDVVDVVDVVVDEMVDVVDVVDIWKFGGLGTGEGPFVPANANNGGAASRTAIISA